MDVTLRPGRIDDADACGRILHDAFKAIADAHNFPPDFPSPAVGAEICRMLLAHPRFHAVVAERGGAIVGSNFLDERATIAGIGPVSVDPALMNGTIGRRLMTAVMDRATARGAPGIRLLQIAWHFRSLALYAKLGFAVRETVSACQGAPLGLVLPGLPVRAARPEDAAACNALCRRAHGIDRAGELDDAIAQGGATVVERQGRVTGYAGGIGWFHHAVGETNDDLKALIAAAPSFDGPGFLVPSRNAELLRWCLDHKLRIVNQATLMTIGLYNEPATPWLPSILY